MTFWNSLSSDIQLLLVILAFALPVMLMITLFTWRDAKRRGMNPVLWSLIAGFSPALMGFLIYLLVRSTHTHLLCTGCGSPVKPTDGSCPGCGAKLQPLCPRCGHIVESSWKTCPICAAALPEGQDITPAVRSRNKALWAMLAMLVVVPLVVGFWIGYYILGDTGPRFFHTRYAPDLTLNEGVVDPMLLEADTWFSYTYTDEAGSTTVTRDSDPFSGKYTVTWPDGTVETRNAAGGGTAIWLDGTVSHFFQEADAPMGSQKYGDGTYHYDLEDRLDSILLRIGQVKPHYTSVALYHVELTFTYDEAGKLVRQEAIRHDRYAYETHSDYLPDAHSRRYVTYTYDENGRLIRAEEFDHTDTLTGYTEYTWSLDASVRFAQHFTPEGQLTHWNVTEFDSRGRLLQQEFYGADNTLTAKAQFSYDLVACLMRPMNLLKLAAIWMGMLFFAGYIVSSSNKETY